MAVLMEMFIGQKELLPKCGCCYAAVYWADRTVIDMWMLLCSCLLGRKNCYQYMEVVRQLFIGQKELLPKCGSCYLGVYWAEIIIITFSQRTNMIDRKVTSWLPS